MYGISNFSAYQKKGGIQIFSCYLQKRVAKGLFKGSTIIKHTLFQKNKFNTSNKSLFCLGGIFKLNYFRLWIFTINDHF
jgi:hypothetical protein